jgi:hypothetical protein
MASDEKVPRGGGGERVEWFTVSHRTLALAGGAIVLLAAIGWFALGRRSPPPPPPVSSIETGARFASAEGKVEVKRAGQLEWVPAAQVPLLRQSDLVRTGSGATAEIHFADGSVFNVRPDSLITIEESTQNPVSRAQRVALSIQSGEANFQTPARTVPGSTTISTPTVRTQAERDTAGAIQVADTGATGLRVFRGQTTAETRTGQRLTLASNQGVRVDAAGAAGPTMSLPTVPQLVAPPNQTEVSFPDLGQGVTLLMWGAVPGASNYRVLVDYSPTFARPLYDRQGVRATQMELRALEAGSYYWKVAAIDGAGSEGSFSELWRFTLTRSAPVAALPLAVDALELRENVLRVRGRTEAGATVTLNGVRLEVDADGSFNEFVAFEGGPGSTVVLRATNARGATAEVRRPVTVAN